MDGDPSIAGFVAVWHALADALQMRRAEAKEATWRSDLAGDSLMLAAARTYCNTLPDDPLQAVAIAVLRSAGYSRLEQWERLCRAAELIPRKLDGGE